MSPAAVPKPSSAGNPKTAILDAANAWVNVRNGPTTSHTDIGDIFDNSLVNYYPASRTGDNWYWVEYQGLSGWVYGGVTTFVESTTTPTTGVYDSTPYDGKVAIWHWKGGAVPEKSIAELVANLKKRAPNVTALFVKTSDSTHWQGEFDSQGGDMAVTGPDAVDRWVQVLQQNGIEFHAWCVLHGTDPDTEANLISAVCKRPGVKSMILDIEPYAGYWSAGAAGVRPLMTKVRQQVGGAFHIGMSVDPRRHHYNSVFPDEWFPFINSIHPQTYWRTFGVSPEAAIADMYSVWGKYGRTIIPVLQGDAEGSDQVAAHTIATQKYGAPGLSWWRYGVISQWSGVSKPVEISSSPGSPTDNPVDNYTNEVLITPGGSDFRSGTYTGQPEFQSFEGRYGWPVYYTPTSEKRSRVWAEWKTQLPESGIYEIATFVPKRHATTTKARFKIHAIKGTDTEVVVDINQSRYNDQWVSLGIFDLEKDKPNAGKVFLNDVTGETGKEIAFDAIRWRRIVTTPGTPSTPADPVTNPDPNPSGPDIVNGVYVANGYDSPVGSEADRRGTRVWPTGWADASPFARLYFVGTPSEAYHTGADLNWGSPYADKGLPVYATASGIVTFAASLSVWGNVIIIRHDPLYTPSGKVMYSRYGHVQDMIVKAGDRVTRGQQIAEIGDAFGRFVPHLHFDLSPTSILERTPQHWPGTDQASLLKNYVDPKLYITKYRPV